MKLMPTAALGFVIQELDKNMICELDSGINLCLTILIRSRKQDEQFLYSPIMSILFHVTEKERV